jgi:hypothetical protein
MADQLDRSESLSDPPLVEQRMGARGQIESITVTWAPGGAEAVALDLVDRCVQVVGDFDGGTVAIEGSNDGATYFTLTSSDSFGCALAFNAPGLKGVADNPAWLRPRRDGAAKTTTIILVGRPRT